MTQFKPSCAQQFENHCSLLICNGNQRILYSIKFNYVRQFVNNSGCFQILPTFNKRLKFTFKAFIIKSKGCFEKYSLDTSFITILYSISVRQYSQPFSICGLFLRLKQFVGTPRAFHSTQGFRPEFNGFIFQSI